MHQGYTQRSDKADGHAAPDAGTVERALDHLRQARSFAEAVSLDRRLFTEPAEFDAWRSGIADLYYMLLQVCTASLALEHGSEVTPQELMAYLDGVQGGKLVNRFVAPEFGVDGTASAGVSVEELRYAHPISKAVVTGTLLRQIKQAAEGLAGHADRRIRDEATTLQLTVQSLALIFADMGAGLLIAAGLGDKLGLGLA
ncbi:MAG TPA: hypothetical protein VF194_06235 [Ferrovibrio sp.]|jgi:hypothetical protein|uniref:hypothetical protein n=1 Tax=Ferrovibrio sp. TaxID=1917215 RepID=UPI002ED52156